LTQERESYRRSEELDQKLAVSAAVAVQMEQAALAHQAAEEVRTGMVYGVWCMVPATTCG
jgi:nucleoside phosphorylase